MIIESLAEWKGLCKLFLQEDYVAVDLETYAIVPEHGKALTKKSALIKDRARIHTISAACSFGSFAIGTDKLSPDFDHLPASEVIRAFKPVLESEKVLKVIHNASYDVAVCLNHRIQVKNYVCTLLMGAIKDANLLKGLKERSMLVGMYQHKMTTLKNIEEFLNYADEDAIAALRLYEGYEFGKINDTGCKVKKDRIEKLKLEKWQRFFVYKQEMPVLDIMIRAERRGILIDTEYLQRLEVVAKEKKNEYLTKIYSHASKVFNVDSGPQIGKFLYEELKMPVEHFTKGGKPAADKKALFYMKDKHPAINDILTYRSVNTLLKSYVNMWTGIAAHTDKKHIVHCSINTHQAVTGRFSVTNPALQTIPRENTVQSVLGDEWSIRQAFIARPGYVMAALDYSQIELRLIAMYAKEKEMIRVLNEGGDLHQLTADLCNISRQSGKSANFGLCLCAGTLVLTSTGLLPIEEVTVGMQVLTHLDRFRRVSETQRKYTAVTMSLVTRQGVTECTPEHGWLCTNKDGWARTDELQPGDRIAGIVGTEPIYEIRRRFHATPIAVYDITVEEDHSFIANGLVSHNCYGMGPWKLADYMTMQGMPTTETQAKVIYNAYHDAYPGIKRFHDECVREHKVKGYVTCLTGRRRHVPELNSTVKRELSAGRRIVCNNIIQSGAGDMLKQAIIRIDNHPRTEELGIHILLQIHDELLFEFPEETADECLEHVKGLMEQHPERVARPITVPILASGGYGPNWGAVK